MGVPHLLDPGFDDVHRIPLVMTDQVRDILQENYRGPVLLCNGAYVIEQRPPGLVPKSLLMARFAECLAGESCAYDVHGGDIIDDVSDVRIHGVAPRPPVVLLIDGGGVSVNICCKNAFMAQSGQCGMETPYAAKKIDEAHGKEPGYRRFNNNLDSSYRYGYGDIVQSKPIG